MSNEFFTAGNVQHLIRIINKFLYDKYDFRMLDELGNDQVMSLFRSLMIQVHRTGAEQEPIEVLNKRTLSLAKDHLKGRFNLGLGLGSKTPLPNERDMLPIHASVSMSLAHQPPLPPPVLASSGATPMPALNNPSYSEVVSRDLADIHSSSPQMGKEDDIAHGQPKPKLISGVDMHPNLLDDAPGEDEFYQKVQNLEFHRDKPLIAGNGESTYRDKLDGGDGIMSMMGTGTSHEHDGGARRNDATSQTLPRELQPHPQPQPQSQPQPLLNEMQDAYTHAPLTTFSFMISGSLREWRHSACRSSFIWAGPLPNGIKRPRLVHVAVPSSIPRPSPYFILRIVGVGGQEDRVTVYPRRDWQPWLYLEPLGAKRSIRPLSPPWTISLEDSSGSLINLGDDSAKVLSSSPLGNGVSTVVIVGAHMDDFGAGDEVQGDNVRCKVLQVSEGRAQGQIQLMIRGSPPMNGTQLMNVYRQIHMYFEYEKTI